MTQEPSNITNKTSSFETALAVLRRAAASNVIQYSLAFLLPLIFCLWQLVDADFGRELVSYLKFSDAALYHYSAWYKSVFSSPSYVSEIIAFSPYESLLSAWLSVFGQPTQSPFVLNAIISGLTCLMLVAITRLLFDKASAWAAIALYVFCTPILFFAGLTLKTSFVICLTSAGILFAVSFFVFNRAWLVIAFTIVVLLASVDRVHVLSALFLLLFCLLWSAAKLERPAIFRRAALLVITIVVCVFFVSSSRYGTEPKYVSNIGLNIYLGHSAPDNFLLKVRGIRNHIIGHRVDSRTVAERNLQRELSQAEVTHYWLTRTVNYIANNPQKYLTGQLQKLHHLFAAQSNSFIGERPFLWRSERWPLRITFVDFAGIFALFLAACWVLITRKQLTVERAYLIAFCLIYLLSVMATIVIERYRMLVLVSMIPIAAWGLVYLINNARRQKGLIIATLLVYAGSQLLAYTAPAAYHANSEKHLAAEKRVIRPSSLKFYNARNDLAKVTDYKSCRGFLRTLPASKYTFDQHRVNNHCRALAAVNR